MQRIAIVGAGVIGAAIAWEMAGQGDIHVFEAQPAPAQGCTAAALGLLMGVLAERGTHKRLASLKRYHDIQTQVPLPGNTRGILHLYQDPQMWEQVCRIMPRRQRQGWALHPLTPAEVHSHFPHLNHTGLLGAVFSPQEWQVQPIPVTQQWLDWAQKQGVQVHVNTPVVRVMPGPPMRLLLPERQHECDWLVISAGLGSTQLAGLTAPFQLEPVLGQAIAVMCPELADYPIVYGQDTAIVPQRDGLVWVGATVEVATSGQPLPQPAHLEHLWHKAIHWCPILQGKPWQRQWYGLRPRPVGQPAPIVQVDPHHAQIIWATGHYRNGVLLAPWTAARVRQVIQGHCSTD